MAFELFGIYKFPFICVFMHECVLMLIRKVKEKTHA